MDKKTTEVQKARLRLLENRKWVDESITELQKKYKNQWIMVQDRQVVDSADTFAELKSKVDKEKRDETLIIIVPNVIARPM